MPVPFNYIIETTLPKSANGRKLPIERGPRRSPGRFTISEDRRVFRRWAADGCFDAVFAGTVLTLHQASLLDISIIHDDGNDGGEEGRLLTLVSAGNKEGRKR